MHQKFQIAHNIVMRSMRTFPITIVDYPFQHHNRFQRQIIVRVKKCFLYQIVVYSTLIENLLLCFIVFRLTHQKDGPHLEIYMTRVVLKSFITNSFSWLLQILLQKITNIQHKWNTFHPPHKMRSTFEWFSSFFAVKFFQSG